METPLPLRPVTDWLRSEAVGRALPALAPRWRSEVARILPELLAADPKLEMPRPMTEGWQQQHFFTALVEAVTSAGEPLLLFVDDLHWADADTLSWLHFLARQTGDRRFLLLATVRYEEVGRRYPLPAWQEGLARLVPIHEIRLEPLHTRATASLASHLLGKGIDEETAAELHAETEGNPLFTVEMVRAGFPQQKAPLPDKVRSVIEIRLSKLTSQAREVAGLAAVIGRSFDFSTLAAASPQPDEEVLASLDELWQKQIVREQDEHGYYFSHDKIRQVTLLQLSPARRRWWHGRVAGALEQSSVAELEIIRGQIAVHWEAAGHPQKAAAHYLEAARVASRLYAHEQVIGYLQRALAPLPDNDAQLTDIYAQTGEAYMALGQFEEAAVAFQEAANRTQDLLKRVNLFARRVRSLNGSRQFEEAKNVYHKALLLLEAAPVAEPERRTWRAWIDLHLSLLNALYFANERDEMEQVCEAMATPVEAHGTARQRAQYLAAVSRMRCRMLRYRLTDEDVAERRAALQWARGTEDDSLIANHQFGLGFILLWAGYPETASDALHQAAAQAEALGNVPLQSRCLTYLGIAYRMLGDEFAVRQTVEKMVPVARAESNGVYLGVAEALRAWLMWKARDIEAAEEHGRAALQRWEAVKSPPYPMEWLARLPLLAVGLERANSTLHLSDAREQARAILISPQQRLPDALTAALERVVVADTPSTTVINLQEACHLAQEQGYL